MKNRFFCRAIAFRHSLVPVQSNTATELQIRGLNYPAQSSYLRHVTKKQHHKSKSQQQRNENSTITPKHRVKLKAKENAYARFDLSILRCKLLWISISLYASSGKVIYFRIYNFLYTLKTVIFTLNYNCNEYSLLWVYYNKFVLVNLCREII